MSTNPPRLLATMAAHPPRLPVLLLLFVFLVVHVPSFTHADPRLPSTYDASICSESFACGGVEIRYPFYLASATEATADYSGNFFSCGYTDLNISCTLQGQSWTPTIHLGGDDYTVESISYGYDHQIISLVDRDVLIGGDCPAVRHPVSFNETWLHDTSSNDNLTFFLGCYPHLWPREPVPLEFDPYKIKCAGFNSPPDAYSFVFTPVELDSVRHLEELATNCSEVFSVPARGDFLRAAARNQSNFTNGGYGSVLKGGFELEWSPITTDQCQRCEESYGRCAYSQKREFMGCLCHGGKVGNPYCIRSSKLPRCSFLTQANGECFNLI